MDTFGVERSEQELPQVLERLGSSVLQWKWCLSDAELWLHPKAGRSWVELAKLAAHDLVWLSGAELMELAPLVSVANWGIFLAFDAQEKDISFSRLPQSEGYVGPIQHERALLEIRAVDGGYFEIVRPSSGPQE